jgi:hypothetical protein
MMSKNEMLLKILEKIWDAWPLWKILLVLWKNWELWDDIIDWLIEIMEEALSKVDDSQQKNKIEKWIQALKKMKEQEEKERAKDNKRVEEIENIIENI